MKMERRFHHRLWRRQGNAFNGDANTGGANPGSDPDDNVWWGNSDAADAVKWSVVTAIVLLLCLWLIGGYYHARRRLRKGLAPLAYHRVRKLVFDNIDISSSWPVICHAPKITTQCTTMVLLARIMAHNIL